MRYVFPLLLLLLLATPALAAPVTSVTTDYDSVGDGQHGVTSSLVLGDAAGKNTGTTTGTVAAGDDARFLKINGVTVDSSALTTGDFLRYNGSQWAHVSLAAGDIPDISATYSPKAGSSSLTTTGTVTSGTWSGSFGAVSGANLTGLTAGNLSGTIPSAVLGNSTHYIGSTAITLNRATASQSLTGINSIDGYAAGLSGGNSTTLLGSIPYQSNTNVTTMLAPNTTSTKKFLRQTGTGTNGAAPAWDTVVKADISDLPTLPSGTIVGTTDTQVLTGKQEAITGTGLTPGSVYYMGASGLALAKADVSSTLPAICIAVSATQCAYSGIYTTGSWTQGQKLYVSDSTAGALTATAPSTTGHFVQAFGVAATSGSVLALPSLDVGGL